MDGAPRPSLLARVFLQEDLNFLLTNRIPRRLATRFMGWFSRLEIGWIRSLSIRVWRLFANDLDLSEARQQRFASLHDCFIRELKDGARPIAPDPAIVTSPCDAVIGACGRVRDAAAFQAKGFPYTLQDLLQDEALVARYRDGHFATLRLRSSMYHRFHAPCDGRLDQVVYVSGDTWNVNPIALRRIERLFCKNERVVLDLRLADPAQGITLVPVAAILVASIRLHCIDEVLDLRYRGANRIPCCFAFTKGQELGWFEHGSTILVFATADFDFCPNVVEGATIRMGEPLFAGLVPATRMTDSPTMAREDR